MTLYYECHITVEPVFDERLDLMKELCKTHGFRVADLLMQKRKSDSPERSRYDTFCTGRHKEAATMYRRMVWMMDSLRDHGFTLWRYKIEAALVDSKYDDELGYVDEANKHKGELLSEV